MSGRIAAVAAVNEDGRLTVFVGSASGGVWKSVNGGTTFKPVFDRQDVQSIGAVAIDPLNPKNRLGGHAAKAGCATASPSATASTNPPMAARTGPTWASRIPSTSPRSSWIPPTATPSTPAPPAMPGTTTPTRGVYKTTRWRQDLAQGAGRREPLHRLRDARHATAQDPKTIYASMWDFRRQAWTFRSGGPGSGLFKSTDGGEHWTEFTPASAKGLPEKPYGRIALAVAPSNPQSRLRHDRIEEQRALPLRRWRRDLDPNSTPASTWCGGRFTSPT